MTNECGLVWRRSSFSGGGDVGGGNCVEAALLQADLAVVRDSKNPTATMTLPRSSLTALLRHVTD